VDKTYRVLLKPIELTRESAMGDEFVYSQSNQEPKRWNSGKSFDSTITVTALR